MLLDRCKSIVPLFYIKPQPAAWCPSSNRIVLYLYSTSNHNLNQLFSTSKELFYTFILHQTTTYCTFSLSNFNCFIPLFYIKPQPNCVTFDWESDCFIPLFYIKPQPALLGDKSGSIVLYLYSTSNHNLDQIFGKHLPIVLYLYSTSNHNRRGSTKSLTFIVLYLYSTSNHNTVESCAEICLIVLYLYSTSNHNIHFITHLFSIIYDTQHMYEVVQNRLTPSKNTKKIPIAMV